MLPLHFTHFRLLLVLLVSLNPPLLTVCSVSRSRWFLLFSLDDTHTHTHTHTHTCVEYFWQLSVWSPLEMSELLGQADLWASAASWKNWKRKKKRQQRDAENTLNYSTSSYQSRHNKQGEPEELNTNCIKGLCFISEFTCWACEQFVSCCQRKNKQKTT